MNKYAIIGTGAVGGFVGSALANSGLSVHFVARSNYKVLATSGILLRQAQRQQHVSPISVYRSIRELPQVDVIIVATKTTDIPSVSKELAKYHPLTTLVALHNGLDPEKLYLGEANNRTLLGGVAYMSAESPSPGVITIDEAPSLVIGPRLESDEPALLVAARIVADFRSAGLEARLSRNLRKERWHKVVWSLVFAGPCTILDIDTRSFASSEELHQLRRQIFAEAQEVAMSDGVSLLSTELDRMLLGARQAPGHVVSMTADRRLGRPLEAEAIYGSVREVGACFSVPTIALDVIHALLTFTQSHNE